MNPNPKIRIERRGNGPRQSAQVVIHVTPEVKREFERLCQALSRSQSEIGGELIVDFINAAHEDDAEYTSSLPIPLASGDTK